MAFWIKARDLHIRDDNDPHRWIWKNLEDREEVAELVSHTVLDIAGKIDSDLLQQHPYEIYFVFKLTAQSKNLDEATATIGTDGVKHQIPLAISPILREKDRWYEVKLGDYIPKSSEGVGELSIFLQGIDEKKKSGLIVRAFEIRRKAHFQ